MKLWSSEHVFHHPWDVVSQAVWRKYPTELNPSVKAIDVLERKISDNGRLTTTRVFGTEWNFPKVLGKLLGIPDMCYAFEHTTVDPHEKSMTLHMMNHTFLGLMGVKEKIVYKQSSEDPNQTIMSHNAEIAVTGIRFENYFENVIVQGFDKNCVNGRQAIENAVAMVNHELDSFVSKCTPIYEAGKAELSEATKSLADVITEAGITATTSEYSMI